MGMLPPGQDVPPGVKATDVISKTLAAISPGQMQEVMAGMKVSWCFSVLGLVSAGVECGQGRKRLMGLTRYLARGHRWAGDRVLMVVIAHKTTAAATARHD